MLERPNTIFSSFNVLINGRWYNPASGLKIFDLYNNIEVLINDLCDVQQSIPSTWEWLDDALN